MKIKEQIEIMQAYVTGEDIEVLADIGSWIGLPKNQPVEFNFQDFTYRIAKPKVESLEDGTRECLRRCLLKLDEVGNELDALFNESLEKEK